MNIEQRLEQIADLLKVIAKNTTPVMVSSEVVVQNQPPAAPATPPPPAAPAAPDFMQQSNCPLKTAEDVANYCKHKYQQNPERGSAMQKIIADLGHTNLTAVRPDQYNTLYTEMEKLV